jgi:hypothetical protein
MSSEIYLFQPQYAQVALTFMKPLITSLCIHSHNPNAFKHAHCLLLLCLVCQRSLSTFAFRLLYKMFTSVDIDVGINSGMWALPSQFEVWPNNRE